jgi:splicing factor 3B subunit 2
MAPGAPPPWLTAQQRHGPPPSYPALRIPGLNAPIPAGAAFGHQPGGWGKPPVDAWGRPLYGDVFGVGADGADGAGAGGFAGDDDAPPEAAGALWGAMDEGGSEGGESESEEEASEADGDAESEEEDAAAAAGAASVASGLASSLPGGLETPAELQLRKAADAHAAAAAPHAGALYQVLEERAAAPRAAGILGTDHVYAMPGGAAAGGERGGTGGGVEAALDPSDLDALAGDGAALRALYEGGGGAAEGAGAAGAREDFSDLVAAKAAAAKRKAPGGAEPEGKKFKF